MARAVGAKRVTKRNKKLRRFELRYVTHKTHGKGWMLFLNGRAHWSWRSLGYYDKREAVANAVYDARWNANNKPSQLYICDKKGVYQTEHTYPRTRDPRRSKG